jgi:hypothetical protein
MSKIKLLLTAAVAMVAMAFAVSNASAYDVSVSPAGGITADSSSLTFSDAGGLINIVCPVTLDGTLDSGPITIAAGNPFGTIDGVTIGACRGGSAVALIGDPWPLQINRVLGTLPNAATGLLFDVVGASFELTVSIFGIPVRCLYSGTAGALMGATGSNPYTTSGTISVLGNTVPKAGGSSVCPSSGRLNGTFNLDPQQTLTIS